jgi:hypothetical protein
MGLEAILRAVARNRAVWWDRIMSLVAERARLDQLDDELRLARRPTLELFSKVFAAVCARFAAPRGMCGAARIERLIATEAWTDAALAFIELETPAWRVRRLVCEDGEWLCSLSRQPNLPLVLDDTVEAGHELLPLAILRAFVEARCKHAVSPRAISAVPQVQMASEPLICCDSFS